MESARIRDVNATGATLTTPVAAKATPAMTGTTTKHGQSSLGAILTAIENEILDLAHGEPRTTRRPTANNSGYEESAVLFGDVVLEPLSDGSEVTVPNDTWREVDRYNVTLANGPTYFNRTVHEVERTLRNDSNMRNFDFLTSSLYNYNMVELFANGSGNHAANGSGQLWDQGNGTAWDGHVNSTWEEDLSPMEGKSLYGNFASFARLKNPKMLLPEFTIGRGEYDLLIRAEWTLA